MGGVGLKKKKKERERCQGKGDARKERQEKKTEEKKTEEGEKGRTRGYGANGVVSDGTIDGKDSVRWKEREKLNRGMDGEGGKGTETKQEHTTCTQRPRRTITTSEQINALTQYKHTRPQTLIFSPVPSPLTHSLFPLCPRLEQSVKIWRIG